MFDTYWNLTKDLFSYQETHQLLSLLRAGLWVLLALISVMIMLHVVYMLGYQSPLYRHRSPRPNWNKHFFTASLAVSVVILMVLLGSGWLTENIPVDRTRQSVIHW